MRLFRFIAPAFTGLLIFNAHLSTALAQGATAFTYQGHLLNSGTNAEGTNGMIFGLYSSASGGSAIGNPITNSVAVSDGLFTVNLDFGAGAFTGAARWLDIAVSNGVTNVELSPRVQILPAPYATYAAGAGTAATAGTATNIAGGVVATGTFAGNGSGLTNVAANLQMEVFANSGTYTFVVPTNVSSIIVEAWGGGGGGGSGSTAYGIGGGGGGAGGYAKNVYNVTPGANFQVLVGAGGSSGVAGGSTSFGGLTLATGGLAGSAGSPTVVSSGGAGGTGPATSSTTSGMKGGNGKFGTDIGGGDGGTAGAGGAGGLGNLGTGGTSGNSPGGGGGGGYFSGTVTGYAGANGEVIVYY
jgi:hypothetical protein